MMNNQWNVSQLITKNIHIETNLKYATHANTMINAPVNIPESVCDT